MGWWKKKGCSGNLVTGMTFVAIVIDNTKCPVFCRVSYDPGRVRENRRGRDSMGRWKKKGCSGNLVTGMTFGAIVIDNTKCPVFCRVSYDQGRVRENRRGRDSIGRWKKKSCSGNLVTGMTFGAIVIDNTKCPVFCRVSYDQGRVRENRRGRDSIDRWKKKSCSGNLVTGMTFGAIVIDNTKCPVFCRVS